MEAQAEVQYIFDEKGNKTAVMVPITIWESMVYMGAENQFISKRKKIESLFGALRGSPILDEIEEYSRKTRNGAIERI
jgi:hypothetical protein